MQQIKNPIREHDFAIVVAMLLENVMQTMPGENFFASVHSVEKPQC